MRFARVGLHVDGDWFCSIACVAAAASRRLRELQSRIDAVLGRPPLRLGTLLVHQGAITAAQLKRALQSQEESRLPIGVELRRLGYADTTEILQGLAAQAGTSYLTSVDPSCVRSAPGGLCRDEVQALGVVPINTVESSRVMVVACVAPVPHAALRALQELTGYKPVPYLVIEEDAKALMAAYGSDGAGAGAVIEASRVDGIHDAAQRIAKAASQHGSVHVSQARVDPFTWVRVAGPHGISAMLVNTDHDDREQEQRWLAETTRH